jgi:hypothetical protein
MIQEKENTEQNVFYVVIVLEIALKML